MMNKADNATARIRYHAQQILNLTEPTPPPVSRAVITPADLTYLGAATLPLDVDGQTRFGYSTGALSGRVVDGAIHLFVTGAQADTGWMDPVYEVAWTGAGTRCTFVANWGDVTKGTRVSAGGNPNPLHGLYWDPVAAVLLWTYMDQYNVGGAHDPCLGASQLLPSGVVVSGPWRLTDHAQRVGGYLVPLPESLASLLGGKRFAAGAPIGSGNASSAWGAFLAAFDLPPAGTPPDTADTWHVTIPSTHLIYADYDHRQPRAADVDECGWTHYGEADSQGRRTATQPHAGRERVHGQRRTVRRVVSAVHDVYADGRALGGGVRDRAAQTRRRDHRATRAHHAPRTRPTYGALGRCHVWYGPAQRIRRRKTLRARAERHAVRLYRDRPGRDDDAIVAVYLQPRRARRRRGRGRARRSCCRPRPTPPI